MLFEHDDILADQGQFTRVLVDLLAKLLGLICKLGNCFETFLVISLQLVAIRPIIPNQVVISFDRALQVGDFALEVATGVSAWLRDGAGVAVGLAASSYWRLPLGMSSMAALSSGAGGGPSPKPGGTGPCGGGGGPHGGGPRSCSM